MTWYKFLPVQNKADTAILELAYIDKFKPSENKLNKFEISNTILTNLPSIDNLSLIHVGTNIQGTKLMKVKKITDVVKNVVASKTDAMLFAYIVDNCKYTI